ncbi:MAG: hypothetical protein ACREPD_18440 [Stenotrophomonas sp.]|uniref:hypothetical protein n=1 Tax=Stenotrophomonas sp. TaxID=69392 RepID=UPI003D6C7D97
MPRMSVRAQPGVRPAPASAALEGLTAQVFALLEQLGPGQPASFHRVADAVGRAKPTALSSEDTQALLRAIKALPARRQLPPRQQMLRDALYDLIRAARAERMLCDQIARHGRRQQANERPGALRAATSSGVGSVVLGLPSAAEVGLGVGAHHETSTSTFDDLAVATVHATTVVGEASARAGVAPGVGLQASVEISSTQGEAIIAVSMRDHVHGLARASVARRLGGNAAQRALKRLAGHRRDRYAERTSRAVAWQPRVRMLLRSAAATDALAFERPAPPPLLAELTTTGGAAAASASYGVGSLSLSGQASRTDFITALPLRLTELDHDGRPATDDPALHAAVETRMATLLAVVPPRCSPTLMQVRSVRAEALRPRLAMRLSAVHQLDAEFHHLESLARHALAAPAQCRAPLASLARDWGQPSTAREPLMIAMLDTLAWLQAAAEPQRADHAEHAAWAQLQKAAQAVAGKIHDSTIVHDRARVHHATHAFRAMTQRIATRRGNLGVSAQLLPLTAAAQVSLARHDREDPDPLRAGTYLELALTARVTADVGGILSQVQQRLPQEWRGMPLEEPQRLLQSIAPQLTTSGSLQCLVRFFQPAFQADPAFPASARGSHLQAIRLGIGSAHQLALTVPLPVLPGLSSSLALKHTRTAQRTRHEWLCAGTLTGTLLRYRSLCSSAEPAARTWAQLVASHGSDLDRLADALADPASVPAQEARYWIERGTDRDDARPDQCDKHLAVLDALREERDIDRRRAWLHAVFELLSERVGRVKAASPLIGAPAL